MGKEAFNVLRRFVRLAARLGPPELSHLAKSAQTLDASDLRKLATEIDGPPRDLKQPMSLRDKLKNLVVTHRARSKRSAASWRSAMVAFIPTADCRPRSAAHRKPK